MRRAQKGYALLETLIAAAIAAGVVVTIAQSLAIAARSAGATKSLNAVITEAEIVAARLEAGVRRDADLLEGLSGWTITSSPYQATTERRAGNEARLMLYVVSHEQGPAFSFERIVLSEGRR